jgi:putative sigma-54 modulation protein
MKITYSGKADGLTEAESRKIDAKFGKIAKLLDMPKGEREAHVILSQERHLHHAEITVHYYEHDLVGIGSAADLYTAMTGALEKLEKQVLRVRERFRDDHRAPKREFDIASAETAETQVQAEMQATEQPSVFRVNHHDGRKPMTLEEAMLEIEGRDYVVYRDAVTDRVSVLVRRRDGNFDLIEA